MAKPRKKSAKSGRGSAKNAGPTRESLRKFIRSRGKEFLEDPNVTSIGIGYAEDGKTLCVQFTVGTKSDEASTLEALGTTVLPETIEIEGILVPTDVLERSYRPDYTVIEATRKSDRKSRLDPVYPGVSVSHPEGTAGTLGAIVYDSQDGSPCMLSNWHVLHGEEGLIGEYVVQPGPADDNDVVRNVVGTLRRSHLGVAGDCAIATIDERGFEPEVLELGTTVRRLGEPELGDVVVKSGRTTGVTYGFVRRVDVIVKIHYGDVIGEESIGCFEIGPDPDRAGPRGEVSEGGDSGSVWLAVNEDDGAASDVMLGLHFAGEGRRNPDEHALACYAKSVFNKLDIQLDPPDAATVAAEPAVARGYDARFMQHEVRVPWLDYEIYRDDTVMLSGSHLIPYMHFSVCMARERRLARFVAWNIDGGSIKRLKRPSTFRVDPRLDSERQIDNSAYASNKLDRGHLARRADLCWGPLVDADRANRDSFYFTNIAPQHERFNQSSRAGLWGRLENAVFADVDVDDLRVAVFAGPIFQASDRLYRGIRIPRDFWKVIAYVEQGDLKARGYVLTQRDLLNDLEALDLDAFRLYQIGLEDLGHLTDMTFRTLTEVDTLAEGGESSPEASISGRSLREITTRDDLMK